MKKRRWAIIAFAVIFAAAYVAMGYTYTQEDYTMCFF